MNNGGNTTYSTTFCLGKQWPKKYDISSVDDVLVVSFRDVVLVCVCVSVCDEAD